MKIKLSVKTIILSTLIFLLIFFLLGYITLTENIAFRKQVTKYVPIQVKNYLNKTHIEIIFPIKEMMSDNAAMIAWNCINKNTKSHQDLFFNANPRLQIK